MSKRNQYSFSKRQREIKKKKKAEEKRLRKQSKLEPIEDEAPESEEAQGDDTEAETTGPEPG